MASHSNRRSSRGLSRSPRPEDRRRRFRVPPQMLHSQVQPRGGRVLLALLAAVLLVLALIPTMAAAGGGIYYAQTAADLKPRLDKLNSYKPFQTSRIFDRNGTLLYEFISSGRRDPVEIDQISEDLINATIAVEDRNFWTNQGVDYLGIARAVYLNFEAGQTVSGASTITQQLIKNVVLTEEEKQEGYERKIKEAVLAQQLTDQYSKEQILELYLNEIPYGNLAYGIQAASQGYFGVNAKDLDLNQASLLAGVPQLPTLYNPMLYLEDGRVLKGVKLKKDEWLNPEKPLPFGITPTRARQVDVLREMVDNKIVTEAQARAAISRDLQMADQQVSLKAPHFVFYIQQVLNEDPEIGPLLASEGGLNITTTLDLKIQDIAQREAKRRIEELEADNRNIHNAAVVIQQPGTGQILSMVGSIDYNAVKPTSKPDEEGNVLDGNVNVTTRERQPGSALKPFTYLSAMNQGVLDPGSILWDVETRFPIRGGANERNLKACAPDPGAFWFCPKNFDQRWHGPLRMRESLANSLNMPAVLALKRAGIGATRELLHNMGITGLQRDDSYYGLAMTLGGGEVTPLDLTTAYNTLANDGKYVKAEPILKITDRDGNVLREAQPNPQQVVDPALVAIVRDFMGDNAARTPLFGRNNPLNLSRPTHAKTGTTDDFRDAWALGFTPYVTVGVWTGNNNNERTERVESTQGGGVIWQRVMEALFADPEIDRFLRGPNLEKPLAFPSPETYGAVKGKVCQIGGSFGQRTNEWFTPKMLEGEQANCDLYKTVNVVRTADGGLCLPVKGVDYGAQRATMRVWNLPKSSDEERIVDRSFSIGKGEDEEEVLQGVAPTNACTTEAVARPTPVPQPTAAPVEAAPPEQPGQPGNPGNPGGNPGVPTQPEPPAVAKLPNLIGLGENQAKALLANLGITSVVVDYQGRDRLGELFDSLPAYAVASHSPGPGTPVQPGMTVILGVRAPE